MTPARSDLARAAATGILALLAGGCAAVRPVDLHPMLPVPSGYVSEFHAPPATVPASAGATTGPQLADEESDAEASDDDPSRSRSGGARQRPKWWTAFADPALDSAIEEALRNNYFIRDVRNLIYENALDPAMPKGALWPLKIDLPATAQHTTVTIPPATTPPPVPAGLTTFNEADVGVTASYQIDVFGQLDVTREVFQDLVDQQRQSTERFAHTLADQVAQLWFEILEQRALGGLLETQVRYDQDLLQIVKARFEQHLATRLAVLQQEQLTLATQAQVPLVNGQLALLNSKLTALLGRTPTPNADLVPYDRRLPDLPPAPALGTPADLMASSPDLRFAQARVAEAEHLKSQNLASWLPTVEAFGGLGAQTYGNRQDFVTSAVGVRLTWPIFDGGQRITRAKQLELTVQRRNWQYQLAFNTALQQVQDALVQEQRQAENLRTLQAQVDLGRSVLREARQLFEQGLSDYLPVLTALTSLSNLERAAIQAQRLLLSYRVQLYHALGGTWSAAAAELPH
jgi:outer membrane protein TolC